MAAMPALKQLQILLVEDNPGDVVLIREALKKDEGSMSLHLAKDGLEAIDFLKREGIFNGAPHPDLILLDLNLPHKNGRDVLAEIKADKEFRSIPVVVFTSSKAECDIKAAYDLHANCYITKPADFEQFIYTIRSVKEFWSNIARLPERR